MRPIQLGSQVGPDGVLYLAVPLGTAEANNHVVVTIEPLPAASGPQLSQHVRSESMYGSCAELGLEEPPDLPLPPLPVE